MSVANKQKANEDTFNGAFMSRTKDTSTVGKVTLNNSADSNSGDQITNAQRAINETMEAVGMTGEGDATRKNYSSQNVVANGDSHKAAIGKIDGKFAGTGGHDHDGTAGGGTKIDSANITYDNSTSGLNATDVEAAIDEVAEVANGAADDLSSHEESATAHTAGSISYTNSTSELTATTAQAAIDELADRPVGGGGGSFVWREYSNAPFEGHESGVDLFDFDYESSQELWAHIQVPSSYSAGSQIKLVGAVFATAATSGNVKFKATTYLLEAGSTVLGTHSNSHDSTNSEVTVNETANTITSIGDIDLTDSSGKINDVAVAAGDILLVKLIRDTDNETANAEDNARLLRYSAAPKFT